MSEPPTCPQHGTELDDRGDHFHCPDCAEFGNGFYGRVAILGPGGT